MEFCPRCQGGSIDAPNCPVCGGSGWIDETAPAAPQPGVSTAPPMAHPSARPRHRLKRGRIDRTPGSNGPTASDEALQARQAAAKKERAKRRRERRAKEREEQRLRAAEEKRIQHLKEVKRRALAKVERERKAREVLAKDLRPAGTEGTVVGATANKRRTGKGRSGALPQQTAKQGSGRQPRRSREEQSAQMARNSQLQDQLTALLKTPKAEDLDLPTSRSENPRETPAGGQATSPHGKGRGSRNRGKPSAGPGTAWRDIPSSDPLQEYRDEFTTEVPGRGAEEDRGRDYGQGFRDRGAFGSMPLHDDHDD